MANCVKCGNSLDEGIQFCPSCGTAATGDIIPSCVKCGKPLDEGIQFCPSCGTAATGDIIPSCVKCGKPLDEGIQFCPSCGTAVTATITPNCVKCGKLLDEGVQFCPSCGTARTGNATNTATQQADPNDAQQNKAMAIIAYILFFIPLLTGDHRKSPFVKFHTNQGLVLLLVYIAVVIVLSIGVAIVSAILVAMDAWMASARFSVMGGVLMGLSGLAFFVFLIIGIINAANGRMQPLPLIGKFTIIK